MMQVLDHHMWFNSVQFTRKIKIQWKKIWLKSLTESCWSEMHVAATITRAQWIWQVNREAMRRLFNMIFLRQIVGWLRQVHLFSTQKRCTIIMLDGIEKFPEYFMLGTTKTTTTTELVPAHPKKYCQAFLCDKTCYMNRWHFLSNRPQKKVYINVNINSSSSNSVTICNVAHNGSCPFRELRELDAMNIRSVLFAYFIYISLSIVIVVVVVLVLFSVLLYFRCIFQLVFFVICKNDEYFWLLLLLLSVVVVVIFSTLAV